MSKNPCLLSVFFCLFTFVFTYSQEHRAIQLPGRGSQGLNSVVKEKDPLVTLVWRGIVREKISDHIAFSYLFFDGADVSSGNNFLPSYYYYKELAWEPETAEAFISSEKFEELGPEEVQVIRSSHGEQDIKIGKQINVGAQIRFFRKKPMMEVSFIPIRINEKTGKYEKLVAFRITEKLSGKKSSPVAPGRVYTTSSVLSTGEWFKIGLSKDGVYKMTYSFLKDCGLDVDAINPQNIRIYGNGGGMLPIQNSEYRPDDLIENAIVVNGESDGKFDAGDYILFYGQGPHRWTLNGTLFRHQQNLYSDTSYYFLTVDLGAGKRIVSAASPSTFNSVVSSFNDFDFYEKDLINPIRSGREWLGESFNIVTDYDFIFSFPNISLESPVTLRAVVAGRTTSGANTFSITANGQPVGTISTSSVTGNYTDIFARVSEGQMSFSPLSSSLNLHIGMSKGSSGAQGWLDFIEVNARRNLVFSGQQIIFRDINSVGTGNVKFQIANAGTEVVVWDVTSPDEGKNQAGLLSGNIFEFISSADSLREYVAFDKSSSLMIPFFSGTVPVQNLHSPSLARLIIVTNPLFKQEAEDLAEFHRTEDGLSTVVSTTSDIYNEFSSGRQDVTAIKDYVKMFFDRAGTNTDSMPRYLLLFGDGSYDFKDRISGNTNFVPAFQSAESLSPTASYVSDDYFGLLNDNEGESPGDFVDLGIGRLVVKTKEEAQAAVNKIKHYYDRKTMGPWRNYLTFIGDDEDGNIHMHQANSIGGIVESNYKKYNVEKIMFDAYKQQVNAGGQRYPDVNSAIDRRIDLGTLMMTYIGHGGELGWAHERILEVSQINKWTNADNMPLFITATCEFSRFDDPQRTSAGEYVFLNASGGGIGLLSTTRLVYSSPNYDIVQAFTDTAFDEIDNVMPRLGDIINATKIKGPKNINSRNFTLLGDPALRLAYPQKNVVTTFTTDTMMALGKATVRGYVADKNGQKLTDFNGVVYPLVFDKAANINSLNNDNVYWDSSGTTVPMIFRFRSQKNVLFKGKASVVNGDFEYTFVVPKDISYQYGSGRISHYGENGETDASGFFEDFIIGGSDSTAPADNSGPQIQLFLNDEKFVFGGITDENPKLFAKLFDENGINTTGNGIGHDIVAVLDENTSKSITLNDYYEAEINSYQRGLIRYPLKDLSDGKHTLKIKAFDVYNNSGEASTEFFVARSAELALHHLLNYPNPFSTNTAFYFEHNQPGQNLDISIQVFTVSGKLVKSIDSYTYADSFRAGPIYWDGRDDYGDKIGKGVYIYKLKVIAPTGQVMSKFEKLVVLN